MDGVRDRSRAADLSPEGPTRTKRLVAMVTLNGHTFITICYFRGTHKALTNNMSGRWDGKLTGLDVFKANPAT